MHESRLSQFDNSGLEIACTKIANLLMKINDFCSVIFFAKCHLSFIAICHSVVDEFALRSKPSPKPSPSLEFEGYQIQEFPGTYDLGDSKLIFREILLVAGDHEVHLCRQGAGHELVVLGIGRHAR